MQIIGYDIEVFKYDWMIVFKDRESKKAYKYHNDNYGVKQFVDEVIQRGAILVGFNNKHYDNYIIKCICMGGSHEEIKNINDFIIQGYQGFDHPFFRNNYMKINTFDIRDDMQKGMSLKSIQGHLGLPIVESDVDFNIDRPLTPEEVAETFIYCENDVDTVLTLLDIRQPYIDAKLELAKAKGIDPLEALYCTNAKLVAKFLEASRLDYDDEREYKYPEKLDLDYITNELLGFFEQLKDETREVDDIVKTKFDTYIKDCPVRYAWGGVHGAMLRYMEHATEDRLLLMFDVASLYPSLMILFNTITRSIPSPQLYIDTKDERLVAKAEGDLNKSEAYKSVLNITFGAMLNRFNDLYDPLNGRATCINGQLFLTELVQRYIEQVEDIRIINFNTDGVAISINKSDYDTILSINKEWETRTGFVLEEDRITGIWQKDVNNYICQFDTGKIKTKGSYVAYGISPVGAWSINNNYPVVKKAITEYFVNGVEPMNTIQATTDPLEFQIIAKASDKYGSAFHMIDGEKVECNKVNRVYATKDSRYGTIYKVKKGTNGVAKIESLPSKCIVDNENKITLDKIDLEWYNQLAVKRIEEFIEGGNNMAETKKTTTTKKGDNVYQKLLKARVEFLKADIKKSGVNRIQEYKYFELKDIIPIATDIFQKVGLIPLVTFGTEIATMTIVNVDDPDDLIQFTSPMREMEAKISKKTGGRITNSMQDLGAEQTYQRRYLYNVALDIVEQDTIDSDAGGKDSITPVPEKREQAKLTLSNKNAVTDEMKDTLKKSLTELVKKKDSEKDFVQQVLKATDGLKNINKTAFDQLMIKISDKMGE